MDTIQLAERIDRIVNDAAFETAVERIQDDIISEWRVAETTDERERAHAELCGLDRILDKLDAIVADGVVDASLRDSQ